jgi:hypothetical protein
MHMRLILIATAVAVALPLFTAAAHAAACARECTCAYQSDLNLCQTITGNDPADYDSSCVQTARDDYHTCVNDCSDPLDFTMR